MQKTDYNPLPKNLAHWEHLSIDKFISNIRHETYIEVVLMLLDRAIESGSFEDEFQLKQIYKQIVSFRQNKENQ